MAKSYVFNKSLFAKERQLAQLITEQTYDGTPGTGYQYFRNTEGKTSSILKEQCVLFIAVEFSEEEAYFLAGPFEHKNKFYGLVTVYRDVEGRTKEQLKTEIMTTKFQPDSLSYMDHISRKRVTDYFGDATAFYRVPGAGNQPYYSGLDLQYGQSDIPADVLNNLVKDEAECSLFFKTKSAQNEVLRLLTAREINDWNEARQKAALKCWQEVEAVSTYAERPFRVHLQGTDDCSFGANFESQEAVISFINELAANGQSFVHSRMLFTN